MFDSRELAGHLRQLAGIHFEPSNRRLDRRQPFAIDLLKPPIKILLLLIESGNPSSCSFGVCVIRALFQEFRKQINGQVVALDREAPLGIEFETPEPLGEVPGDIYPLHGFEILRFEFVSPRDGPGAFLQHQEFLRFRYYAADHDIPVFRCDFNEILFREQLLRVRRKILLAQLAAADGGSGEQERKKKDRQP